MIRFLFLLIRKSDRDFCTDTDLAFDGNFSLVQFNQGFCNRKAQSPPIMGFVRVFLAAHERIDDLRKNLRINPMPRIRHNDFHPSAIRFHLNSDVTILGREFDRI